MRPNPKDWYVFGNVPNPDEVLREMLNHKRRIVGLGPGSAAGINLVEMIRACMNASRFVMPDYFAGVSVGALVSLAVATSFPLETMATSFPQTLREVISFNRITHWRTPMDMEVLETLIFNKILGLWVSNLQRFKSNLDTHARHWIKNNKEAQWDTIEAQTPEVFVLITNAKTCEQYLCALGLKRIVRTVQWGLDDVTEHLMYVATQKIKASMSLPAPAACPVYIRGESNLPEGFYVDGALGTRGPFPIDYMREEIIATDVTTTDHLVQVICSRSLVVHPAPILNALGPVCMWYAGTHEGIIRAVIDFDTRVAAELPNALLKMPVTALALVPGHGREEIPVHKITKIQLGAAKRYAGRFAHAL